MVAKNDNIDIEERIEEEAEEPTEEQEEDIEEELDEDSLDSKEDDQDDREDIAEDYPNPEPEQKFNPHVIISQAINSQDTVRTTFLTESEVGKPLFSVRFLLDLFSDAQRLDSFITNSYNDENGKPLELKLQLLPSYYWNKTQNITASGMSNKGFVMNLNVTQKRDMTRKRFKGVSDVKNEAQAK